MNRGLFILIVALVAAAVTFCTWRFLATKPVRDAMRSDQAEMEWLRKEFRLSDAEVQRVAALHRDYWPKCEMLCARVMAANERSQAAIEASDSVTPEVERALREAAALDAECRAAMLDHAYAVSKVMGGERGERYLAMMRKQAIAPPLMEHSEHHGVTEHSH